MGPLSFSFEFAFYCWSLSHSKLTVLSQMTLHVLLCSTQIRSQLERCLPDMVAYKYTVVQTFLKPYHVGAGKDLR